MLGVAGAASEFVYNFILDIKGVPEDIQSQTIKIQCLHQTIVILVALYGPNRTVPELQLDPFVEENVRKFLAEVQTLESRLKECSLKLEGSRKQHVWERLRWLSSDRELRKFYASLDTWMHIFSTALTTTGLSMIP